MALSASDAELLELARAELPRLFRDHPLLDAFAKLFGGVRDEQVAWLDRCFISTASGVWLDEHAREKGLWRRQYETDASLRDRVVSIEDQVTHGAILDRLITFSLENTAGLVELPLHSVKLGISTLSRGYRMYRGRGMIVAIIHNPVESVTELDILVFLRLARAAGVGYAVETIEV